MKRFTLAVAVLLTACLSTANASIINSSFEDDLDGWSASNRSARVVSEHIATNGTSAVVVKPTDGSKFATVWAGSPTTTLMSDMFTVSSGNTVLFDWFFDGRDYLPFNDWSISLLSIDGSIVGSHLLASITRVGANGFTGWNTTSFGAQNSGVAKLTFQSSNIGDTYFSSVAGFDNVRIETVAEPSIITLFGVSIVGLTFVSRRRRMSKDSPVLTHIAS